jgi:hypothetical protein
VFLPSQDFLAWGTPLFTLTNRRHRRWFHYQNKGPIPFGFEPSASDFVMVSLLVCNVSIARMQFFHRGFLRQLHSTLVLEVCPRGKTPVRSLPFSGGRTQCCPLAWDWGSVMFNGTCVYVPLLWRRDFNGPRLLGRS